MHPVDFWPWQLAASMGWLSITGCTSLSRMKGRSRPFLERSSINDHCQKGTFLCCHGGLRHMNCFKCSMHPIVGQHEDYQDWEALDKTKHQQFNTKTYSKDHALSLAAGSCFSALSNDSSLLRLAPWVFPE